MYFALNVTTVQYADIKVGNRERSKHKNDKYRTI